MRNTLLDLGNHYVSDFLENTEAAYENKTKAPLSLVMDEKIGAPKLTQAVEPSEMYGKYWYHSGTNSSMTQQLKDVVDEIKGRVPFKRGDIWLDIACNDGTLLRWVPRDFVKLGIDPVEDSFLKLSSGVADCVVQDYFSEEAYGKTGYGDKKCKVITTIAMFYDLDNPAPFVKDVEKVLDDEGVWVIQLSYTPLMVKQMAFDNICHEHIYYYSLSSIKNLMEPLGFEIVDCSLNDTNGGSFRVYLRKKGAKESSFASKPLRDVCSLRVDSILNYESNVLDISDPKVWSAFEEQLNKLKEETVTFIRGEVAKGKKIYGYGASTKGNTLLQYYGLSSSDITAIAERSPEKYGTFTVGSNIPIVSESQMRKDKPDYLLVLPWHFIKEFTSRERKFLDGGGKFIVPCPKFEIIEK